MKFTLLVSCRTFAINPLDQAASLFELIDVFNSSKFPFVIPQLTFVFQSIREDNEPMEMPIECEVFNNDISLKKTTQVLKYSNSNRNRYMLTARNLKIEAEGKIMAVLYYNNRQNNVAISIDINKVPAPANLQNKS